MGAPGKGRAPSRARAEPRRYGTETVVLSPVAEMLNVP
jgi:hypothetical protein